MDVFTYGQYKVEMEYIRRKYGKYRWDCRLSKNGEVVSQGINHSLNYLDPKLALIEFLIEGIMFESLDEEAVCIDFPRVDSKVINKFIKEHFDFNVTVTKLRDEQKDEMITYLLHKESIAV